MFFQSVHPPFQNHSPKTILISKLSGHSIVESKSVFNPITWRIKVFLLPKRQGPSDTGSRMQCHCSKHSPCSRTPVTTHLLQKHATQSESRIEVSSPHLKTSEQHSPVDYITSMPPKFSRLLSSVLIHFRPILTETWVVHSCPELSSDILQDFPILVSSSSHPHPSLATLVHPCFLLSTTVPFSSRSHQTIIQPLAYQLSSSRVHPRQDSSILVHFCSLRMAPRTQKPLNTPYTPEAWLHSPLSVVVVTVALLVLLLVLLVVLLLCTALQFPACKLTPPSSAQRPHSAIASALSPKVDSMMQWRRLRRPGCLVFALPFGRDGVGGGTREYLQLTRVSWSCPVYAFATNPAALPWFWGSNALFLEPVLRFSVSVILGYVVSLDLGR